MKSDRRHRRDVGFRFLPTDEELVVGYLLSKLTGNPLPSDDYVKDCNLYGDLEPLEIWNQFRGCSGQEEDEEAGDSNDGKNDLYFFTPLKKRTATGSRIDRTVGSNGGAWHGEDSGKESTALDGVVSWTLKRFSYREKKNKGQERNTTTSWIMHEYCLLDRPIPCLGLDSAAAATKLALCRIRKKEDSKKRKYSKLPKVILIHIDDDYGEAESSIENDDGLGSTIKRRKVDGDVGEEVLVPSFESFFSGVKDDCTGGDHDEGAVFSYVTELERCLSEVTEHCSGGGNSDEEETVSSYAAELEECLLEVNEDFGGSNHDE